jgi:octaprenyl-diphosphate synthase
MQSLFQSILSSRYESLCAAVGNLRFTDSYIFSTSNRYHSLWRETEIRQGLLIKSCFAGKIDVMNLKDIQRPVEHLLKDTDLLIRERVKSNIPLIDKISQAAPISKGKKIRSTLMFLLAGMNGSLSPQLPEMAASIEMFHLSSLIHDDVVDNSDYRRGAQTLHSNVGNNMSVMFGDFMFISAFSAMNNIGPKVLMDISLEAARLMVEGQIIEIGNTFNFNIEEDTYYDIIQKKTSSLFSAVSKIAAVSSNVNTEITETMEAYNQFGLHFGTIFQVSDDMLDIFSEKSGKDRFGDLKEGKITLPYILLLKKCKEDIRPVLSQKNEEKILSYFEEYNIKEATMKEIRDIHTKALNFIEPFPDSVYKESIVGLLDFIKYRDY